MNGNGARERITVVHDIPGRLRLRLPDRERNASLAETVVAIPGVTSATWSPRTRSLLVLYAREMVSADAIVTAVARHAGVTVDTLRLPARLGTRPAEATLGGAATQAATQLDQRLRQASRGIVGLSSLLPVGLTAWAVLKILRGRAAPLAWSSALWYAHGLFRDYQLPRAD